MDHLSTELRDRPSSPAPLVAPSAPRPLSIRYGNAVATTLLALLLKVVLGPVIVPSVFITFYAAVFWSAWFGGVGPGVLATVLGAVLGDVLFLPSAESAEGAAQLTRLRTVLFVVVALSLTWAIEAVMRVRRRAGATLTAAREELEVRVQERTAELRDVNQRLTDEVARRSEAEERFRRSLEYAPIGMALVSLDDRPLQINAALCRMLGYTREELLDTPVAAVMHPDDLTTANAERARLLAGEIESYHAERRYLHRSGAIVWVEVGVSLVRDHAGRPMNLVSHLRDVTEHKHAEAAIRHSEQSLRDQASWLQSILNSLGEAVVVADKNGKLLYFNPVAERLHGRGLADIALADWSREYGVYWPDGTLAPPEELALARVIRGEPQIVDQEFAVRPQGQDVLIPVSVTATPVASEDGSLLGGVVVYRDISNIKQAEARLRRNEARLNEAERLAHVGAWEWDVATNEAIWSDEQFRIFGLDPRGPMIEYDRFIDSIVPEGGPLVETAVADALAGRRPFELECRIRRPQGEIRDVYVQGEVIRDVTGRAIRMVGSMVDVTERKHAEAELERRVAARTAELRNEIRQRQKAEAALRDSEQRFRAVFDQAPVGVSVVGPDRRWIMMNDQLCEFLGYSRDELMQRTFRDVTYAEDLAADEILLRQVLANEIQTFTIDKRYVRKDGSLFWATVTASSVRDDDGTPMYGISVVQDISARKHAEAELRAAEERLRRLVEQLPAITYVLALDEAQSTLYISLQVEATLGFTPAEWTGDPDLWNRQLHPRDRQRVVAEVTHSHATGTPFSSDYRMYRRDGALIWFHDEAVVIRDEAGKLLFTEGVMIDITARKQAEEELEAAERRTRTILEEMTDAFYTLDQAGRFTYLNPSALRLVGQLKDDLLGKNIWEVFPAGVGSTFHEHYLRAMGERTPMHLETYYAPLNRWLRVHAYPLQEGLSVLVEDVTETHEKEVTTLSDILRALNAELDVAAAFPRVAAGLKLLTECDRSSLAFFDRDYEGATVVALSDVRVDVASGTRLRMSDIPAAANVIHGRPHIVPDLAVELHSPIVERIYADGFRSVLCLPLRGTEQVLGMLTLTWRKLEAGRAGQLPLLNQIADAVALATEKSRLFEEVRLGRERLEVLSHRLLEVQEAERQHIARELHDEIGQALTALKLSLDRAAGLSPAAAVPRLNDTRQQVNDLVARVRNLALDLRPAMLDDLGLLPALLWLFERYAAQTGVRVGFEHRGLERRFSAEIETAGYRIVQEALTNVARHAGVRQVTVRAWSDQRSLSVQVVDQGAGFEPGVALTGGTTSGVAGMRERALLLGGSLTVESAGGKGTRVSAELPIGNNSNEVNPCP